METNKTVLKAKRTKINDHTTFMSFLASVFLGLKIN